MCLFFNVTKLIQTSAMFLFKSYETENGILAEETGQIEKTDSGDDTIRATGFYKYIGDDGQQYRVDYVADINGFTATVCILFISKFEVIFCLILFFFCWNYLPESASTHFTTHSAWNPRTTWYFDHQATRHRITINTSFEFNENRMIRAHDIWQ